MLIFADHLNLFHSTRTYTSCLFISLQLLIISHTRTTLLPMYRFSRLSYRLINTVGQSPIRSGVTLLSVPLLYNTLPTSKWLGIGGSKNNGSNVDVEIDSNNSNQQYSVDSATQSPSKSAGSGSELDALLDELFGKKSSQFDPIDEISKSVPRYLWPQFFTDLVDRHQHARYSRDSNTHSRYVVDDSDTTSQLLGWLHNLAPAHANFWNWTEELVKPFHLHLQDSGSEYSMRISCKNLSRNDIKVRVNDNVLTVIGEKQYSNDINNDTIQSQHRSVSAQQQSIRLPADADKHKLKAKYNDNDNALYITIPKLTSNYTRNREIKIE